MMNVLGRLTEQVQGKTQGAARAYARKRGYRIGCLLEQFGRILLFQHMTFPLRIQ